MTESHGARACATRTRCAEPTIASRLAVSVGERTIAPTTQFHIWTRLLRREVRASGRLYARRRSCLRDFWCAWRIRDCRSASRSAKWWGAGLRGGAGKRVDGVTPGLPQVFRYQRRDQWTIATEDEGGWCKTAEQGAERFMAKWIAAEKARTGRRHAVVCPNMTGRTNKKRIASSNRPHPGSLTRVD